MQWNVILTSDSEYRAGRFCRRLCGFIFSLGLVSLMSSPIPQAAEAGEFVVTGQNAIEVNAEPVGDGLYVVRYSNIFQCRCHSEDIRSIKVTKSFGVGS